MTERDTNQGAGFQPGSAYPAGGNPARDVSSSSAGAAPTFPSAGQTDSATLKDKVAEDLQTANSAVRSEFSRAKQKASDVASEKKHFAADRVSGVASAIEKVGNELEQGDQPEVGRYAKQIGSSIQRFAGDMEGKDMGEIAAMADDFGRRQPAAFLGIAALAGFAASRFLTASSERRAEPSSATRPSAPRTAGTQATTSASPVGPTTGANYSTGYSTEGKYNG
jgi:hypothetical protein